MGEPIKTRKKNLAGRVVHDALGRVVQVHKGGGGSFEPSGDDFFFHFDYLSSAGTNLPHLSSAGTNFSFILMKKIERGEDKKEWQQK